MLSPRGTEASEESAICALTVMLSPRGTKYPKNRLSKAKPRYLFRQRGFCSGDVLLSHNLSSHYHRGCSVSLPCSEWERVGPLRYDHQKADAFHCRLKISDCRLVPAKVLSSTCVRVSGDPASLIFPKNRFQIVNLRSEICNSADSLMSTYRKCSAFKASFC